MGQGYSNFRNNKKKCVFIKRFASAVVDSVLGPGDSRNKTRLAKVVIVANSVGHNSL